MILSPACEEAVTVIWYEVVRQLSDTERYEPINLSRSGTDSFLQAEKIEVDKTTSNSKVVEAILVIFIVENFKLNDRIKKNVQ